MVKNKAIFVGRQRELDQLKKLCLRQKPSLAVIKGRRRVGKSRLVAELASQVSQSRFVHFAGLAPIEGIRAEHQRDHFSQQLAEQFKLPKVSFQDWSEGLNYLAHYLKPGDIVLMDEISWMGSDDPTFIPKLKVFWDALVFKQSRILLVFCGSVSVWIEQNILNSTAFFGRIDLTLTLEPLSIPEAAELLKKLKFKGSAFEIYTLLAVLGGIPWYLEQVDPEEMAEKNIRRLFFQKESLLFLEFDRIFHDLLGSKGAMAKKILDCLNKGPKNLSEVRASLGLAPGGNLSQMMSALIISGFVDQHPHWSLKTGKSLKQSLYRISDPYIRFYLKVLEPNKNLIEQGRFLADSHSLGSLLPGFETTLGLQVEILLLQNHALLLKSMGIQAVDCVWDGPYRQSKTQRTQGCQIDYLAQTKTKNIFVAECKFKKRELGLEIIEEVEERIKRFSKPRGFALVPVLFHIGGVSSGVYDQGYFYRVIDMADLLNT